VPSPRLKHMIGEANKDNQSRERAFYSYITASEKDR